MNNQITVLMDNTAGKKGLLGEHGLSFLIEVKGARVLFDTGPGEVLCHNASKLGIDLNDLDAVILSHGHYDHTGGIKDVLHPGPKRKVMVHPGAFGPKFSQNPDGSARDVGMPNLTRQRLHDWAQIFNVTAPVEVVRNLHLTGPIPRVTAEDTGGAFFTDSNCTYPDQLTDDQAGFINTAQGVVVILGCAHAGVINTLRYVRKLTNGAGIHTVIGGMHLVNASDERLDQTVAELRSENVQRLLPCHCTGFLPSARLATEFATSFVPVKVGTVIDIPGI